MAWRQSLGRVLAGMLFMGSALVFVPYWAMTLFWAEGTSLANATTLLVRMWGVDHMRLRLIVLLALPFALAALALTSWMARSDRWQPGSMLFWLSVACFVACLYAIEELAPLVAAATWLALRFRHTPREPGFAKMAPRQIVGLAVLVAGVAVLSLGFVFDVGATAAYLVISAGALMLLFGGRHVRGI
jgi:hypothetical protein